MNRWIPDSSVEIHKHSMFVIRVMQHTGLLYNTQPAGMGWGCMVLGNKFTHTLDKNPYDV